MVRTSLMCGQTAFSFYIWAGGKGSGELPTVFFRDLAPYEASCANAHAI